MRVLQRISQVKPSKLFLSADGPKGIMKKRMSQNPKTNRRKNEIGNVSSERYMQTRI